MITRAQIVEAARSFAPDKASGRPGVPYKAGGSDRSGLSCAGLLVAVARDVGYLDEEIPGFSSFNEAEPLRKWFGMYLDEIPLAELKPGDIVSMEFGEQGEQHCAFLVTPLSERGIKYSYFIHSLRTRGVVESRLHGPYLAGVKAAFRMRGIID